MSTTNYVLLSANQRYGVNLNQILTNHLLEHGVEIDGQLTINYDTFAKDITTDLTFVLFNKPDQALVAIQAAINGDEPLGNVILGFSNMQDLHTSGRGDISADRFPDISYEGQVATQLRQRHQIVGVDSEDGDVYRSLSFTPERQFKNQVTESEILRAIKFIKEQIKADVTSRGFYLVDHYRKVEPFNTQAAKQAKLLYKEQAKHYKRVISLDPVELARVNDADRKLYDQYQFRTQLHESADTALVLHQFEQ